MDYLTGLNISIYMLTPEAESLESEKEDTALEAESERREMLLAVKMA